MRPLSEATARVTGKNFARKYVALGRIVSQWKEIVGEALATKAQPVKINYRKSKEGKAPIATLDIAVSSADATLLHYQKDLILERINQLFGDRWVSAIRFVHAPSNMQSKGPKKTAKPLTADEKDSLSSMLADIVDEEIRNRLQHLGEGILKSDKP